MNGRKKRSKCFTFFSFNVTLFSFLWILPSFEIFNPVHLCLQNPRLNKKHKWKKFIFFHSVGSNKDECFEKWREEARLSEENGEKKRKNKRIHKTFFMFTWYLVSSVAVHQAALVSLTLDLPSPSPSSPRSSSPPPFSSGSFPSSSSPPCWTSGVCPLGIQKDDDYARQPM